MNATIRGSAAAAALLVFLAAGDAAAQGKGRGLGRGKNKGRQAAGETAVAGTGLRHFGAWLDDATMLPAGKGWVTLSAGYWRSTFGRQWDAPAMDAGVAVTRRLQLGISAPVSRVEYTDGSTLQGLGDTYVTAKIGLVDPEASGRTWGLAVAPVAEILSSGSVTEGSRRVQWALPVTLEKRFATFRVYGSAGYFSRGAAFGAAALELPVDDRLSGTLALTHSRSLDDDPLSDALQLSRVRTDVAAGASYLVSDKATVFASIGRTVSRIDENASSIGVSAGVSLGFQHRFTRR